MGLARHDFTPTELAEQLAAERRGQPFLLYRDAAKTQRLLPLKGERMTVGREEGNDLTLEWDVEVSRVHSVLELLGSSWTVVDEDLSRNGTFVNGARVRGRRRLSDRDVLSFGSTQALFRHPGGEANETPPMKSHAAVAGVTEAQQRVLVALCAPLLDALGEAGAPPSNRVIATELTVSVEAVRSHLKTLFRLFEVPDLPQNQKRAELARRALASGVVAPRDLRH